PLAKTGGLADVVAALPAYLHGAGHDVRLLVPRYARIDNQGLRIEPVRNLQNLTMRIGSWDVSYSIDTTTLPGSGLPIYLLRCPELYGRDGIYTQDDDEHLRFILLSRAAIEMCQRMRFSPHIFHCHDWHTALIPLYLRCVYSWDKLFTYTKSVLTIHNIGYQGVFPADVLNDLNLGGGVDLLHQGDLTAGRINFMKTGVLYADLLTAVSPRYAHEIQGSEYGAGLDDLLRQRSDTVIGILNGVDYDAWDPATDKLIPNNYSSADLSGKAQCKHKLVSDLEILGGAQRPLVGIVSRLVAQKGIELIENVLPRLLQQHDFSVAVLGSGERRYEQFFSQLQNRFRDRVCYYRGYNEKLAHWIEAGADMFLMPSLYEPCGLNQMYSLKYGTVPVVRETGGLADSVEQINLRTGTGTGILFRDYNDDALRWAMNTALDLFANKRLWRKIIGNGMAMDFSWQRQGEQYVELFRRLSNVS
ncbi:MAG: glycogen synthase, partial [Gammaproteobacteria bacterium]|nr:glycogen synthase [Gammaproteobacteria bacterium]